MRVNLSAESKGRGEEPQRRDSLNELKTACLHGGRLTHSEEEEKFASKDGDAAERGRELTGSPAV